MGIFWPLDCPTHIIRLAGLVGVVAGCCALVDRDTRYTILRHLYIQLKKLDEEAASHIEATDTSLQDKRRLDGLVQQPGAISSNNARDTRSFASDSTAFSRAGSPQRHVLEGLHGEPITQPSSAQCNTPEAVTQLGEALSRLQLQQQGSRADKYTTSAPYVPSPLSQVATGLSIDDGNGGNSNLQPEAVASDEILLPLTNNGPPTPQPDPKPKAIDTSKRLTPLPNPNAPKIKPTMQNGRPQIYDYTPPVETPTVQRRERGHIELETTESPNIGFVTNPSALVPKLPANSAPSVTDSGPGNMAAAGDGGDHYLFVCVKCHRQSTNEVCEKICSDEDGVLRCKLRPGNGQLMEDLEDLVMPMTPKMYTDGRRKTTGRMLYENLKALHAQHERVKERAACRGSEPHSHDNPLGSRECPNAVKSRLRIVPVNCLSMCHLGNVVAVSAPGKFGYQFGAMHENDSEDMQAILQFAEDYIESQEGFTKNKTRPPRLSRNILARIPPPLPSFTSISE
ncbi:hypothetical protein IWW36_000290 [Coemansia brasiliensis]|uniref:Uncharacterized protein n=1 Tax=Coemansia brasiliensis TaxID=2650707 RepID=A0A9W8IG24_9FUNG|nr:hypothetical protein IWW36_000290 [Coemansia brasiliensis]